MVALPGSAKTASVTSVLTRSSQRGAESYRVRRLMAAFIGGGYVAYFFVSLPEIRADAVVVASWWTPLALVLAFVPGGGLLLASLVHRSRWIDNALPLACGGGYLVAVASWFFAWNGMQIAGPRTIWLVVFPGLASLAVVLSRRPWLACLHLLIAIPSVLVANGLARTERYGAWATVGDVAWAVAFSAVFVLAGITAVRTGDVLDAAREQDAQSAARVAEQRARDTERLWYQLSIHDNVLSVLQHVRSGPADPELAGHARRAMSFLDGGRRASEGASVGLLPMMQAAIAAIDPRIAVTGQPPLGDDLEVPPTVAEELIAATAEAARNCVRHAGHGATSRVHIESDAGQVRITVIDDGDGFDCHAVPKDRMGLSLSIEHRVTAMGGRVTVDSRPGAGTRVCLEWSP